LKELPFDAKQQQKIRKYMKGLKGRKKKKTLFKSLARYNLVFYYTVKNIFIYLMKRISGVKK